MAKLRTHSKKHNGIKIVVKKPQKSLLLGKNSNFYSYEYEEIRDSTNAPDDVKGHGGVLAKYGDEPKCFIVPLNYPINLTFIRLSEPAAEEYGFIVKAHSQFHAGRVSSKEYWLKKKKNGMTIAVLLLNGVLAIPW